MTTKTQTTTTTTQTKLNFMKIKSFVQKLKAQCHYIEEAALVMENAFPNYIANKYTEYI